MGVRRPSLPNLQPRDLMTEDRSAAMTDAEQEAATKLLQKRWSPADIASCVILSRWTGQPVMTIAVMFAVIMNDLSRLPETDGEFEE